MSVMIFKSQNKNKGNSHNRITSRVYMYTDENQLVTKKTQNKHVKVNYKHKYRFQLQNMPAIQN